MKRGIQIKNKINYIIFFILITGIIISGIIFIFRTEVLSHYIPAVEQIGDVHVKVEKDTCYISSELSVRNKSFLRIGVDTIKYKVALFNKTYLQSQKFIGMILPGYGKDTVGFSLKIPYKRIIDDLKTERKNGDSTSYSINIFLQYSTPFTKEEIPINKSAKIKIPQPPEIEVVEIKYKKVRMKSILADAKIKIINYSGVTLSIKDLNYCMTILKQGNLAGRYKEPIYIKPNGTSYIHFPLEININNIGRTIFDVLINKDNYDYELTLNAILESPDPSKESFHIDLVKSGTMELKK